MSIRVATLDDAAAIAAIYAPIVANTFISFETEPPGAEEIARRITSTLPALPWLVSVDARGEVDGYAYASRHRERAAYQWSVDTTVYVRADRQRQGVGRALYDALLPMLRDLGYCNAFAGVALPNDGSVALHESAGFRALGVFRRAGYKLGGWRDVGWWQLQLRADDEPRRPSLGRSTERAATNPATGSGGTADC